MPKNLLNYLFFGYALAFYYLIFILINHFGRLQFSGMDGGVLVNAAYIGSLGYKYYQDVITATPPLFLIGAKLSFVIFGTKWSSLVLLSAFFSSACFIIHTFLLRRFGWSIFWSLLFSFYCQSVIWITISFWWYNRMTVSVILLFLTAALLLIQQPKSLVNQTILTILTALLALSKPNMAGPAILLTVLVFVTNSNWKSGLIIIVNGLLIAIGILLIFHINPLEVVQNYLYAGGRLFSLNIWLDNYFRNYQWEVKQTVLFSLPAITGFTVFMSALYRKQVRFHSPGEPPLSGVTPGEFGALFLSIGSFFLGFWGMGTNNDYNMVDETLVIFAAVALFQLVKNQMVGRKILAFVSLCLAVSIILLSANAIIIGYKRLNVEAAGYGAFYERVPLTQIKTPQLFSGVFAGPRLLLTTQEIESVLQKIPIYDRQHIFFGPRIDWAYAAYGITPPRGLPLWWEAFSDGKSKAAMEMIERFKEKNFKVAFLYYRDYTFLPQEIVSYLNNNYQQTDGKNITVYFRQSAAEY